MNAMTSQIINLTIVYSTVYSGADHISTPLAFVMENHQWTVNSPREGPLTRKMFPLDNVIMQL